MLSFGKYLSSTPIGMKDGMCKYIYRADNSVNGSIAVIYVFVFWLVLT